MLTVPQTILDKILAQAREESPNECCGLLGGQGDKIHEIYPILNLDSGDPMAQALQVPEDRRLRYVMDPKAQFMAIKQMRSAGMELTGIYHSHPHSPAYPSPTDVRLAFYPEAYYLIASLAEDKAPIIRAFRIVEARVTEEAILPIPLVG